MEKEILQVLNNYSVRRKTPHVSLSGFREYLKTSDEGRALDAQEIEPPLEKQLLPLLESLAGKKKCTLIEEDGEVKYILVHDYAASLIKAEYQLIHNYPQRPFPTEKGLKLSLPLSKILVINIKNDFVNTIERFGNIKEPVIKITFPDSIESLVVTPDLIKTSLIECSVYKISHYLQMGMNIGYIHNRLNSILKGTEMALTNILNDIQTKQKTAALSLFEPDDFSFKFWSHFTNLIIQDFKGKKDKTPEEIGYCQASYLIGYYIIYQKGVIQREQQIQHDIKEIEVNIKKPPYAFTLEDLFKFKDKKGITYIKKYTEQFIFDFIKKRTIVGEDNKLPEIISIKVGKNKNFFIQRDLIVPLFLQKLFNASRELKTVYADKWRESLRENIKSVAMKDDVSFLMEIEETLKKYHQLLYALLNPNLLYVAKEETNISSDSKEVIEKCFDKNNRLKSLDILLDLDRKLLLNEAKSGLPVWYFIPIVKHIFLFIKNIIEVWMEKPRGEQRGLWSSLRKEERKEQRNAIGKTYKGNSIGSSLRRDVNSRLSQIEYNKGIIRLKELFIGKDKDIKESLEDLEEKWNPLFDPVAKQNLVEDINALIRDFMRSMRRSFRSKLPDEKRLRDLAGELALNKALSSIKKKEYLKQYIAIYMIYYLSLQRQI